ncbi:winged helix-turn-helix transcriptional regulator [Micromonospora aurantiaca]|uniref:winged helix-turn-helix transcriptional regulator n=1 Tax=Micromonospora aurantiaca (nom. illeg.) TaxID=47850 RepID=UPI0038218EF2
MNGARGKRSYDQQCALAYALDVVGERWTLLVIRELLHGPRRYNQLLEALPGIGTNLLAARLAALVDAGLLTPTEPRKRTGGYQLTDLGRSLHEPILGLSRFGLAYAAGHELPTGSTVRASWAVLAIEAMVDDGRTGEIDESYEFRVDDEIFHVDVRAGHAEVVAGPAGAPSLTVRTDARSFFSLGMRQLDPIEALVSGQVAAVGVPAAVTRCLRLLGITPDVAVSTDRLADVGPAPV